MSIPTIKHCLRCGAKCNALERNGRREFWCATRGHGLQHSFAVERPASQSASQPVSGSVSQLSGHPVSDLSTGNTEEPVRRAVPRLADPADDGITKTDPDPKLQEYEKAPAPDSGEVDAPLTEGTQLPEDTNQRSADNAPAAEDDDLEGAVN